MGNGRAEADSKMLELAFFETPEYRALASNTDSTIVVGRRGTGKSALYKKLVDKFQAEKKLVVCSYSPQESDMIRIKSNIGRMSDKFTLQRAVSKTIWQIALLTEIASVNREFYKSANQASRDFLREFSSKHRSLMSLQVAERGAVISEFLGKADVEHFGDHFRLLSEEFDINRLRAALADLIQSSKRSVVLLIDQIDEGWEPDSTHTAVISGLIAGLMDLNDAPPHVHSFVFVRDNVNRSIAHFDSDYTRTIEPSIMRLHWDDNALFRMITARLRIALEISAESDVKIWNRFAKHNLTGRTGFAEVLNHTLYRPRDLIVLLNETQGFAGKDRRIEIIPGDLLKAASSISRIRLTDLKNEYSKVLPGVDHFTEIFKGVSAEMNYRDVIELIDRETAILEYDDEGERDFAIFGNSDEIFEALFGIGFLGVYDSEAGVFTYCHDGSPSSPNVEPDTRLMVHPCYWLAMELRVEGGQTPEVVGVNDEYAVGSITMVKDQRVKRLGQLLEELNNIELGVEGASDFEKWCLRTAKTVFGGGLKNMELHPNRNNVSRRDIVATIDTQEGFWGRINRDYSTRQLVIEIKNKLELDVDDYRQVHSYLSRDYGKFGMIIYRYEEEFPPESEIAYAKEFWTMHEVLVLSVPITLLQKAIQKMRTPNRPAYGEDRLGRRLDRFVRSHFGTQAGKKAHRSRKKTKK